LWPVRFRSSYGKSIPVPEFFVRRGGATELPAPDPDGAHIAIDRIRLGGRHLAEQEWTVASDGIGNLLALPEGLTSSSATSSAT
jgi:hypothetical protein